MTTRRELLGGLAASALTSAVGCGGRQVAAGSQGAAAPPMSRPSPSVIDKPIGPASGELSTAVFEPSRDGALLWAWHGNRRVADIEVVDRDGHRVVHQQFELAPERGKTGHTAITGLLADQSYRYRAHFHGDGMSPWAQFKTLPPIDDDKPVHFVFGADIISMEKYRSDITDHMVATGADYFVSLGDWPYCDIPERASSLAEFREAHRIARRMPEWQGLLRKMGLYCIYDDHEIRNDWNSTTATTEPKKFAAGLQAWSEYFPLAGARRYRKWRWGRHAELFMLDLRLYKTPHKDPDGPGKTMLGAQQKKWLTEGLAKSTASFKIILTSVPLDYGTTSEHWQYYQHERDQLIDFIRRRKITGVVALTADQHWFAAHHHPSGLREFQVGPVMAFTRDPAKRVANVVARSVEPNFGEITIVGKPDPRLVFTCRNVKGEAIYAETVTPRALV